MKTRIVVIVFTLLFVLCGLFPPWTNFGHWNKGYQFLFDPPVQSHVDLGRLFVEWVLVAVVGAAAWWLAGGKAKEPTEKDWERMRKKWIERLGTP